MSLQRSNDIPMNSNFSQCKDEHFTVESFQFPFIKFTFIWMKRMWRFLSSKFLRTWFQLFNKAGVGINISRPYVNDYLWYESDFDNIIYFIRSLYVTQFHLFSTDNQIQIPKKVMWFLKSFAFLVSSSRMFCIRLFSFKRARWSKYNAITIILFACGTFTQPTFMT